MSGLPRVEVVQTNNNLGRIAASEDGIAALIVTGVGVSGKFTLGDVIGPLSSIEDVKSIGIDDDYDVANNSMAYLHCSDFYAEAGKGAKLYLMVLDDNITMTQMCDKANNYARKLIEATEGKVKLIGVTRIPDSGYTPNYVDQLDDDILNAAAKAQELRDDQFGVPNQRISQFLIEGRDWQGNVVNTKDLRDGNQNYSRVSIVMCQNAEVAANPDYSFNTKYASVGLVLGRLAAIPVQRCIGRVKNERVKTITLAGYSNAQGFTTLTDTQRDTLNDKGYIFLRRFNGKVGFYFNDDPTITPLTDDYCYIGRSRTIDKACMLAIQVLTDYVNDDVEVEQDTGKILPSIIKNIEANIETHIQRNMVGEISGVDAYIDPAQDIISTDELKAELAIIPKGYFKKIKVTVGYRNPNITLTT